MDQLFLCDLREKESGRSTGTRSYNSEQPPNFPETEPVTTVSDARTVFRGFKRGARGTEPGAEMFINTPYVLPNEVRTHLFRL